ncbi:alpha/beta fold hydrolase [Micromonospora sp. bgisy143]|uniref:dienelactone hydrolase family protein n=1 Tax=Micromonospora sp. bgisy143 TaxID=3413790 RepID=UPI003EB74739
MSAAPPRHPPSPRIAVLLAVLATVTAALGATVLVRADAGLTVRHVTVDGVPMTEVRAGPPNPEVRRPGVVIAHGFAGSARLMRPIADTVARRGAVALVFDFAGHGANPARLGTGMSSVTLAADLDVAVGFLRSQPDVDPAQIMLVGHSMGAGAVTRYAVEHPEIARTVAISLPEAGELPPGRPTELLLIVGGAEFPGFRRAADDAARRGATVGRRPAVVVPGVEHISVLFAPRTHEEILHWLPSADGNASPRPLARLAGAALLLVAFAVGLVPLAALLLGRRPAPTSAAGRRAAGEPALRGPALLGLVVVASGLAAGVATVLPTSRLPLAVGGYVTGFLLVTGLLTIVGHRWLPAATRAPEVVEEQVGSRTPTRTTVAASALTAYAILAVALPIHLGLTWARPVGARWWLLPLVVGACLVFLLGVEVVAAGRTWRRLLAVAVTVVALCAAVVFGLAPGFVLLVVPLFAVLLGWHVLWAAVLRRYASPRWLPALVGAALLGWPIATTLPLT